MTTELQKNISLADQIRELAKAKGISVAEYLKKMIEGSRRITSFRTIYESTTKPDSENGGTGLGR